MTDERFTDLPGAEPRTPYRPRETDPRPDPKGKPSAAEVEEHLKEYRRRMGIGEPKPTGEPEGKPC